MGRSSARYESAPLHSWFAGEKDEQGNDLKPESRPEKSTGKEKKGKGNSPPREKISISPLPRGSKRRKIPQNPAGRKEKFDLPVNREKKKRRAAVAAQESFLQS